MMPAAPDSASAAKTGNHDVSSEHVRVLFSIAFLQTLFNSTQRSALLSFLLNIDSNFLLIIFLFCRNLSIQVIIRSYFVIFAYMEPVIEWTWI